MHFLQTMKSFASFNLSGFAWGGFFSVCVAGGEVLWRLGFSWGFFVVGWLGFSWFGVL